MEAAEFTKSCKTRDNLFDVYIRGVVSEVDETLCLGAKFLGDSKAGSPVGDYCRVKRRLIQLVFNKHAPIVGQGARHDTHRRDISVERLRHIRLTSEIRPIADPDRQSP